MRVWENELQLGLHKSQGVVGSQPMSTAVSRSPNKLWRSKSIFNLWSLWLDLYQFLPHRISLHSTFNGVSAVLPQMLPLITMSPDLCTWHLQLSIMYGGCGFGWEAESLTNSRQKSKSFPPCYSRSPTQLCHEIFISSNSCNLLQFLQFSYCKLKRRKEEILMENHTPFSMV